MANLILHPIRMQIVLAMVNRQLTPGQLCELLPDVPQATLYRHLNQLVKGGLIKVVEERQVRGTVEKAYALNGGSNVSTAEEFARITKEEMTQMFTSFAIGLMADFNRYMERNEVGDMLKDRVMFRQAPLYLSNEETDQLLQEFGMLLMRAYENKPAPGRHRRVFTSIFMPVSELPGETEKKD